MEFAARAMSAASRAASSNTVINGFLFASFTALSIRSFNQQRDIETLELQKQSLLNSNKAVKKTIWDWKQQLYGEASAIENAVVPLSKLKSIYGEAPTSPPGEDSERAYRGTPTKILV